MCCSADRIRRGARAGMRPVGLTWLVFLGWERWSDFVCHFSLFFWLVRRGWRLEVGLRWRMEIGGMKRCGICV